jgi:hypothetical protein
MSPNHENKTTEEEWRLAVERLCERFPAFSPERVMEILIEADGHAGQAAARLRDLSASGMRPIDPEEAEHVKTILSSPTIFAAACQDQFQKYDLNQDSVLEWDEVLAMTNRLHQSFGLEPPRQGSLQEFFEESDVNGDGVLQLSEFTTFYEKFMRLAYGQLNNNGRLGGRNGSRIDWQQNGHRRQKQEKVADKSSILGADLGLGLVLKQGQVAGTRGGELRGSPNKAEGSASSPAGSRCRAHSRS